MVARKKQPMPGSKPTTEKKRRWKADANELDELIVYKSEREAEMARLKIEGEQQLNLLVEDMKETAKDHKGEPIPEEVRGKVILRGRYFVEV